MTQGNTAHKYKVFEESKDLEILDGSADELIKKWEFFLPKIEITKRIWQLSEKIDRAEAAADIEELYAKDEDILADVPDITPEEKKQLNRNFRKRSWFERLLTRFTEVMFHDDGSQPVMTDDEYSEFFQKLVAEKVYDHLAMLCRTPHAINRGEFSLTEEFTRGMAPKFGLGLYVTAETTPEIMADCYQALHDLAAQFEEWFVETREGFFEASFGDVYSHTYALREPKETAGFRDPLLLAADVSDENRESTELARAQLEKKHVRVHTGRMGA